MMGWGDLGGGDVREAGDLREGVDRESCLDGRNPWNRGTITGH